MKFGSVTITIKRESPKTLDGLTPEEKLDAIRAMGFTAVWDNHQPDCYHDGGNRCICVPPGTSWYAPPDVKAFMHETWDELRAMALARDTDN